MLTLDGSGLSIADLVAVARAGLPVGMSDGSREAMAASHQVVSRLDEDDAVAYGVTTGFGALADRAIPAADRSVLQRAVILSHSAGLGAPVDPEIVRGMLLLRARTLAAGLSGVRPAVADALLELLNRGLVPWVPEHGSLGASGDLVPLAHAAACLLGEGWFGDSRGRRPAREVLAEHSIGVLDLAPKEGLALINGTDGMAAVLALAVADLGELLTFADCVCALTAEVSLASAASFDSAVVQLRAAPGQTDSAANLRALLAGSPMVAAHRASRHAVQDAYSIRCAPQVQGAARDLVEVVRSTVVREMASVVDNPVVLMEEARLASNGNFHGQALAYAADMGAAVCADLAALSERRVDRLLDPARSRGLPAFLSPDPGRNSGFMAAQYTSVDLVTSLRTAASPLAVQNIPTCNGQEDHVSMGWTAALRTRRSIADLRRVLAVEAVCAAQAAHLRTPLTPGAATSALIHSLRAAGVAPLIEDRVLAGDLESAVAWVKSARWRPAVEALTGALR